MFIFRLVLSKKFATWHRELYLGKCSIKHLRQQMLSIYTLIVLKQSHLSVPYKDQKCVVLHPYQLIVTFFNSIILNEIKAPQNFCALQYTDSKNAFENNMCMLSSDKEGIVYLHYLVPRAATLYIQT